MPQSPRANLRFLALDLGEVRIGLAVSDPTGTLCTPLEAIRRKGTQDDFRRILDCAASLEATGIVVGLPVTMEGHHGTQAAAAARYRESLRALTDLPVVLFDERLSTVEATSRLRAAGHTSRGDKGRVDSAAAAVILESYLASLRRSRPASGIRSQPASSMTEPGYAPPPLPRRRRTSPPDRPGGWRGRPPTG